MTYPATRIPREILCALALPPQLWLADPAREPLHPNRFEPPGAHQLGCPVKPEGGLWTSSEIEGWGGTSWAGWCLANDWGVPEGETWRAWRLRPHPAERLLLIDGVEDLELAMAVYGEPVRGWPSPRFAWGKLLAAGLAGIRLTARGQAETRLSFPANLYGWDVESTLWLRWAFVDVEDLGLRTLGLYPGHDEDLEPT